jgi:hypothetical protein
MCVHAVCQVDEIKSLAQELGVTIIQAHKMDATKALLPATKETPTTTTTTSSSSSSSSHCPGTSPAQRQPAPSGSTTPDAAERGGAAEKPVEDTAVAGPEASPAASIAALSDKAQQRLRRRLAAMALRGHAPPPSELRAAGLAPPQHPGFPSESFDHILLDAPCTALGVRPRLQSPHSLGALLQTAAYQRRLLDVAVQLLRPGGTLVYSTCSFNPGGCAAVAGTSTASSGRHLLMRMGLTSPEGASHCTKTRSSVAGGLSIPRWAVPGCPPNLSNCVHRMAAASM